MTTIEYQFDEKELKQSIEDALSLEDNEMLFGQLAAVANAKNEVKDLLEKVEEIEREAKGLINSKAKALYGESWQAIAGKGYKITRSKAGAVYTRLEDAKIAKKFIKIVESLDTKAIDAELEKTGKLPAGLDFNPSRAEVIKVTIK